MPTTSESEPFLWNYEVINWSDGSTPSPTEPAIIGTHGRKGETGAQGAHGINTATVELFTNNSSYLNTLPANGATYYFEDYNGHSAGELVGTLNGWTQSQPNSAPIWKITAVALGNGKTDNIDNDDWTTPIKITGTDGTSPVMYTVVPSDSVIVRDVNNNTITPNYITVSGTKYEGSSTSSVSTSNLKVYYYTGSSPISIARDSSTGRYNIPSSVYSTVKKLEARVEISGSVKDSQIIPVVNSGADTYTFGLTNENHTFIADSEGVPISGSEELNKITTTAYVYKGSTSLNISNISYTAPTGITISTSGASITIEVSSTAAQSGTIDFTITTSENKSYTTTFSYSIVKDGGTGPQGPSGYSRA